jgi:putative transposase
MANTYTQIYIHIVFAVQGRQNLIRREDNDELQKDMTGIVSGQGQKLLAINNMPEHFHILIGQRPDVALSDLVCNIKAGSSGFINDRGWLAGGFSWQEGFGAFSYSHSQLSAVIRYIQNQEHHHRRKSPSEEYVELLKRFNVPHDQRYLFQALNSVRCRSYGADRVLAR